MNYLKSSVTPLLRDYLARIGQDETQPFGDGMREPTGADGEHLLQGLRGTQENNSKILYIAVALLVILFFLGMFLVVRFVDQPTILAVVIGGNVFSLLIIVVWLRKLWLEKSTMDALLTIVGTLEPREAARVIIAFHFKAMNSSSQPALETELHSHQGK